jgi:hypothetical protein
MGHVIVSVSMVVLGSWSVLSVVVMVNANDDGGEQKAQAVKTG